MARARTATAQAVRATETAYTSAQPPLGRFRPEPPLDAAWHAYLGGFLGAYLPNFLGWATQPASTGPAWLQELDGWSDGGMCRSQSSLLLRLGEESRVYFLVARNFGLHAEACRDGWELFPAPLLPGTPQPEPTPPAGKVIPKGIFGQVWRERLFGKTPGVGQGYARSQEEPFSATTQPFERGLMVYHHQRRTIYVLFQSFDYLTRGGEQRGRRVWFLESAP